jgi:hypothetical protein
MLSDLPPRHFADATGPLIGDAGPFNWVGIAESDYNSYLRWLVNHLQTASLPLHPRQLAYAAIADGQTPETAVFWLANNFGCAHMELDDLNHHLDKGGTWAEWEQEDHQAWLEQPDDIRAEQPFEEYSIGQERFDQLREEWEAEQRLAPGTRCADIPYRALLARILRRVPEGKPRLDLLHDFFRIFSENAAK